MKSESGILELTSSLTDNEGGVKMAAVQEDHVHAYTLADSLERVQRASAELLDAILPSD